MSKTAPLAASAVDIDARGQNCPWPAVRLARAMRDAVDAVIVADDAVAPREIAALAGEQGWEIEAVATEIGHGWRVRR